MSPPTPAATASTAAFRRVSRVCWTTPGIEAIGTGSLMPSRTNSGQDQLRRVQPGLGDQAPHRRGGAQPARRPELRRTFRLP